MKRAICLYSGGLDSTTALFYARHEGYEVEALTLDYGQRHIKEAEIAENLARELSIKQHRLQMALPWGGSALTDTQREVPTGRDESQMQSEIPATYVPARNTIFLAFASSMAEAREAEAVFIGANILDYSGYPDCRPEYLESFEAMIALGTKMGREGSQLQIKAPLLKMNKKEIIELGLDLKVPFERTWSCYLGGEKPCGECDSCILRAKGFREAGVEDPLLKIPMNKSQ